MLEDESLTSEAEGDTERNDSSIKKKQYNKQNRHPIDYSNEKKGIYKDGKIIDIDEDDKIAMMYAKHKRRLSI
jgi:hypothetical protein